MKTITFYFILFFMVLFLEKKFLFHCSGVFRTLSHIYDGMLFWKYRTSSRRCSVKKVFLKMSQNSRENTCWSLFFNKVADLKPATLLQRDSNTRCSSLNFAKFLETPFFKEYLRWLLLKIRFLVMNYICEKKHVWRDNKHNSENFPYVLNEWPLSVSWLNKEFLG